MEAETYQGWANRETWALMLYVNNDQGLYEWAREVIGHGPTPPSGSPADALRDWAETLLDPAAYRSEYGDRQPESLAVIAHDIGSLWRVDWAECVAALSEDGAA